MSITGSIVVYVIIWWIVFFSALPISNKHKYRQFDNNLEGTEPGAPKNTNNLKKFYTTLITTVIFIAIYYIVESNRFNLREFIK